MQHAIACFAFLTERGFRLIKEWEFGRGHSLGGWELVYSSDQGVTVRVLYSDWSLDVTFIRAEMRVSYLDIDRELYARRSGYHGSMFGPDKVGAAVDTIARDIALHYASILSGDADAWALAVRRTSVKPTRRLP